MIIARSRAARALIYPFISSSRLVLGLVVSSAAPTSAVLAQPSATPAIVTVDGARNTEIKTEADDDVIFLSGNTTVSVSHSAEAETTATSTKNAVAGGDGKNVITNQGTVSASSTATAKPAGGEPSQATAGAAALKSGNGTDNIVSDGSLTASSTTTATSTHVVFPLPDKDENTTAATSTTTVISSGGGDDTLTTKGTITGSGNATAEATDIEVRILGIAKINASSQATTHVTGIDSGDGNDFVSSGTQITLTSIAKTESWEVDISATTLNLSGSAVDAKTQATATADGIKGGTGSDSLVNRSVVSASSNATATSTSIAVKGLSAIRTDGSTTADATSTGMDGGDGEDTITQTNKISVNATSKAVGVSVSASLLESNEKGDADTSITANSTSSGISGGSGNDTIVGAGTIETTSDATATNVGFSALLYGFSGGDYATAANATATGIDGGSGNNSILNNAGLSITSTATTTSVGVTLVNNGVPTDPLEWMKVVKWSDSSTEGTSKAFGITAGEGNNTVTNTGLIEAKATSNVDSLSVSAEVSWKSGKKPEPPKNSPEAGEAAGILLATSASEPPATSTTSTALEKASTHADATADGILGGIQNDTITNFGSSIATAQADSISHDIGVTVSNNRTEGWDVLGEIGMTNTSTSAQALAAGINGGAGNDLITNQNLAKATAQATATTAAAAVRYQGDTENDEKFEKELGTSIIRSGTGTLATATGLAGEQGDDIATNDGRVIVSATSDATAATLALTVASGNSGFVGGASYADASTNATSTGTGISGGPGTDVLTNRNYIDVSSNATATSWSVSGTGTGTSGTDTGKKGKVTVTGTAKDKPGITVGVSIADGSTNAAAEAIGISSADSVNATTPDTSADVVSNSGQISVNAHAKAVSTSVAAEIGVETNASGLSAGVTYANVKTQSSTDAYGVKTGLGDDQIIHTGGTSVEGNAEATGVTVGLTGNGVKGKGGAVGVAVARGSLETETNATGISSGAGNDSITSLGVISVVGKTDSTAAGVTVTVTAAKEGLALGGSFADVKTTSTTHAIGIDGGAGKDNISNGAKITVTSSADIHNTSVSVTGEGAMSGVTAGVSLADAHSTSTATATGINSSVPNETVDIGTVDDVVIDSGEMTVDAHANAVSTSVSAAISVILKNSPSLAAGFSYADVTNTVTADAVGIDTGSGDDQIVHTGSTTITGNAESKGVSVGVTASGVAGTGGAIGVSVVEGSVTTTDHSTGLASGAGNDSITSSGIIDVTGKAKSTAVGASIGVAAAKEGLSLAGSFAGVHTTATAYATGVDGGSGQDNISNSATITASTDAQAVSVSVGVTASGAMKGVAAGLSLADAHSTATASSTGIAGGEGSDRVTNSGAITSTSSANTVGASATSTIAFTQTGFTAGVAAADLSLTSDADASAIDGGVGDDTITNTANLKTSSSAVTKGASVSVTVGVAVTGVAGGAALVDGHTTATSDATGLNGDTGDDSIINSGKNEVSAYSHVAAANVGVAFTGTSAGVAGAGAIVDGDNTVTTNATGLNGGAGADRLYNYSQTLVSSEALSERANIAVTGSLSGQGVAASISIAKAAATANSTSTGMEGGADNDILLNNASLQSNATTNATTVAGAVAISLGTVSASGSTASANTTSNATSAGMSGGAADDQIENQQNGSVSGASNASATAVGFSAGVATLSYSDAKATTLADARFTGLSGGIGNDTLINSGSIVLGSTNGEAVNALSTAKGSSGAANLAGYGSADVSVTSRATSIGLDGGENNDTLANTKTINIASKAVATGTSVSFNLVGAVKSDGSTTAESIATGMTGGAGDDTAVSSGSIKLSSEATADMTGVSVTLGGYGASDGSSTAHATLVGLSGGDGANSLGNASTGTITGTALASGETGSVSVALLGATTANASSTVTADVSALQGGSGADTIENAGHAELTATSTNTASAKAVKIAGAGSVTSSATSNANATGISGGAGVNTLSNLAGGSLILMASATGQANSYDITVAGGEKAEAKTTSTARTTGILSDAGVDTVTNQGTMTLSANSTLTASSKQITIVGAGSAEANSTASAVVTGIDAGAGANTVVNGTSGAISAEATTTATANNVAVTIGISGVDGSTQATGQVTGIKTGDDVDKIYNYGTITGKAKVLTTTTGGSLSLVSVAIGSSNPAATLEGIMAGGGNDIIVNTGSITLKGIEIPDPKDATKRIDGPISSSQLGSVGLLSAIDLASMHLMGNAQLTGIGGGAGDDAVTNSGTITVGSTGWMSESTAGAFSVDAVNLLGMTSVGGKASTASVGIDGGSGSDTITNDASGQLNITATSRASTTSSAKVMAAGGKAAFATTNTDASAKGMSGGAGTDTLLNKGGIAVSTDTLAEGHATSTVGWGQPYAETNASGSSTASGIDAGEGGDSVSNSGTITVASKAQSNATADADSDISSNESIANSTSTATAYGVQQGDVAATTTNEAGGAMTVTSTAVGHATAVADEKPSALTKLNATASGIATGAGNHVVVNNGQIKVTSITGNAALTTTDVQASGSSMTDTAVATAERQGTAKARGFSVADGATNLTNSGSLEVSAQNYGYAYANYSSPHLDQSNATAGYNDETLVSDAAGISAGHGNNTINNTSTILVQSDVKSKTYASTNTDTHNNHAYSYSGGDAQGTGISIGNGNNLINSHGNITVQSTVTSNAESHANTWSGICYGEAFSGGDARATGISAGSGQNTINLFADLKVSATANAAARGYAEDNGRARVGNESTAGVMAEAWGILVGLGNNSILNQKTLEATATATGTAFAKADTTWVDANGGVVANSAAAATGILTANGNNSVVNTGTINVTATASTSVSLDVSSTFNDEIRYYYQTSSAKAVGIQTGSGNDIINNLGIITTSLTQKGATASGIAIDSGAGNDEVTLGAASHTTGAIALGAGDDSLAIRGGAAITGAVDAGAGTDSLVLDGAGSLSNAFTGFERATKQGAGTFIIANFSTVQRLAVNEGVLQIGSNYTMGATSTYSTVINTDGTSGRLNVIGTATLNGALVVARGPGLFTNSHTYDIITANALTGGFTAITLPESTELITFRSNQNAQRFQVAANVNSYTTVAASGDQIPVAAYLDAIATNASGDLLNVLSTVQNLPRSQFEQAYNSLSSSSYDHMATATFTGIHQNFENLGQRIAQVRAGRLGTGLADTLSTVRLAQASRGSFGQDYTASHPKQNDAWASALKQWGDQEDTPGYPGYDVNAVTLSAGYDHVFPSQMAIGVSVSRGTLDVDLRNNSGKGSAKSTSATVYGSCFNQHAYVDAAFSYGRTSYENKRLLTIGTIQRLAESNHDGSSYSAYLGTGYAFKSGSWVFGPTAALRYARVSEDGFAETGAGGLNLNVQDRQTNSLASELGLRAETGLRIGGGVLMPQVTLGMSYDFDIDDRVITASYEDSPSISFAMPGQKAKKVGTLVGGGVTWVSSSGFSISAKYKGEFRGSNPSHVLYGQFSIPF
ncbi:MAG: hypothetical protein QM790_16015 [Nibricoccus sp.]